MENEKKELWDNVVEEGAERKERFGIKKKKVELNIWENLK